MSRTQSQSRPYLYISLGVAIVGVFCFLGWVTQAATERSVVINEIAWMGTIVSANAEWIELHNTTSDAIDISGWQVVAADGTPTITLASGTVIMAGEYGVLERTSEATVASTTALLIYSGALGNDGEVLELRDASGAVIDHLDFGSGWPAGDNTSKQTMARIVAADPALAANWQASNEVGGTPGMANAITSPPPTNALPVAQIIAPTTAETDELIEFDGRDSVDSDGSIVNFEWDFGDTATTTGATTTHSYSSAGDYHVTLVVTDDQGATSTATTSISITDPGGSSGGGGSTTTPERAPASGEIIINEVVMDPVTGTEEWLELYNRTTSILSLAGLVVIEGAGSTTTLAGTIAPQGYVLVSDIIGSLNNDGDSIYLKDASSTILDQISYGTWDDGFVADNAPTARDPYSIIRYPDGTDSGTDANDFAVTTTLTPGATNTLVAPPVTSGGGGSTLGQSPSIVTTAQPSDIVINEIMSDPGDSGQEWLELYNTTSVDINCTGWRLKDAGGAITTLSGTIVGHGFMLVSSPKGSLNNAGDRITLLDGAMTMIDSVSYGDVPGSQAASTATLARDGASIIRFPDGVDRDTDREDWHVTSYPTPGAPNRLSDPAGADVLTQVRLSELLPNPSGSEIDDEYIELFNSGTTTVRLAGTVLADESSVYTFSDDQTIGPGEYFIIYRSISRLALNNTGGETVTLRDAAGRLADSVSYDGAAPSDQSYTRLSDESWQWLSPTPAAAPLAVGGPVSVLIRQSQIRAGVGEAIRFDAASSTGPGPYFWDFGDGGTAVGDVVEHSYAVEGTYHIAVIVGTGEQVVVGHAVAVVGSTTIPSLYVSEIVPNPAGDDRAQEFIELHNPFEWPVTVNGWSLQDSDGRVYELAGELLPGEYRTLYRPVTKLTLPNSEGEVRLLMPSSSVDHVTYDDAREGQSYSLVALQWSWSATPTPGAGNMQTSAPAKKAARGVSPRPVPLAALQTLPLNTLVQATGTVSALPGVLGSQTLYLAGSGIQVYMYKKDFPNLRLGDHVRVTGVITQADGERRIKLSTRGDIVVTGSGPAPSPHQISLDAVADDIVGSLVRVRGTVIERRGATVVIAEGSDEVTIYFKATTAISSDAVDEGDVIEVTGILSRSGDAYRILPRSRDDIVLIQRPEVRGSMESNTPPALDYRSWWIVGVAGLIIGGIVVSRWRHKYRANYDQHVERK